MHERRHDHLLVRRPHAGSAAPARATTSCRSPACATPCPRSTTSGRRCRRGDVEGDIMPLAMQAIMVRNSLKHVQDEVRTPEMVGPILEIYEAACGAALTERPYFSVTNCTIAPLQHDREMTEAGLHALQARRADLRAAHASGRHDRAGDGPLRLHRQHGRAALGHRSLPARQPGLRHHLGRRRRRRRHAHRRLHRGGARDRPDQHDLHRDEPLLRAADAGHRHVVRRQGGQLPVRFRGRHDGARGRPDRRPTR